MIAPFKPAAECDDRDVIHLKGFAARLDFEDAATARQADALIDAVAAHKRSSPSLCVAWDGDAPADESFTRLLRRCASLGCGLIAFCYAADEAAFRKAWGPEGLAIRGYVVDEPPDDVACRWAFLGVSALRATRAAEPRRRAWDRRQRPDAARAGHTARGGAGEITPAPARPTCAVLVHLPPVTR